MGTYIGIVKYDKEREDKIEAIDRFCNFYPNDPEEIKDEVLRETFTKLLEQYDSLIQERYDNSLEFSDTKKSPLNLNGSSWYNLYISEPILGLEYKFDRYEREYAIYPPYKLKTVIRRMKRIRKMYTKNSIAFNWITIRIEFLQSCVDNNYMIYKC